MGIISQNNIVWCTFFYSIFLIESFLCNNSQNKFYAHCLTTIEVLIYEIQIITYYFIALGPSYNSKANIAQLLHFCPHLV